MKANELMIGDWVDFYHPYEPEKKIVTRHRVTECYECGLVAISNHQNPVHADHIEPIPLTAEILKKNGFTNENSDDEYGDEMEIELILDQWYIENEEGTTYSFGKLIRYVHELQHALKLCGIDKQITI